MLIRFQVKNLLSFKEETEFNLLPGRVKRLDHHKYSRNGLEILKLSAIYGANGSGKSNLIRAISLLRDVAVKGAIPQTLISQKFKLSEQSQKEPVELAIEFATNNSIYFYSIAINDGIVVDEYFSHNDENQEDQLIFHRQHINKKPTVTFFKEFDLSEENKTLKKIIETDLLKPFQPLFGLLNTISNDAFVDIRVAHKWFSNDLIIIYPNSKASGLVFHIETNTAFKEFAREVMCSFNTGITNMKIDVKTIEQFFGKDNQREIDLIKTALRNDPNQGASLTNQVNNEEILIINKDGQILVKRLLFEHKGDKNRDIEFTVEEESDGTRRLLEYLPALNSVIERSPTYVIDEIERSIHPLIIKEIVKKFSLDESTKGQLIFSTHESILLDQDIFRSDEIWFTEKDPLGSTKIYPLSDFKEHSTIDIRKGYLNGRYGAIPFLGNIRDLNWHI